MKADGAIKKFKGGGGGGSSFRIKREQEEGHWQGREAGFLLIAWAIRKGKGRYWPEKCRERGGVCIQKRKGMWLNSIPKSIKGKGGVKKVVRWRFNKTT